MSKIMDELIQENIYKNNLEIAKKMIKDGLSFDIIQDYFPNITIENLEALKKETTKTA